jgi:GTPase Era involved in 16S rRNA processing
MNIIDKIDYLIPESSFPIYGKKKSKIWLDYREKIVSAKKAAVLTSLMKSMEKDVKSGKLTFDELMDLVDKTDQKKIMMGKKGAK